MTDTQRESRTNVTIGEVYTVEEAAVILRIGRNAAYAAVRAGEIPSVRLGRLIRVPGHALLEMLRAAQ